MCYNYSNKNYYLGTTSATLISLFGTRIRRRQDLIIKWFVELVDGLELGAVHDRDEQVNDPYATSAVLSGLLPDTKYRVHIYAKTQYGRGEGMFIEVITLEKTGKSLNTAYVNNYW